MTFFFAKSCITGIGLPEKKGAQCADINRQKIVGESLSSGKVRQIVGTSSHGRLPEE